MTDRDIFAAADDDLVLVRDHGRALWTAEMMEKFPHCPLFVELFADRCGATVTLGLADMAEPQRRIERGQPARQHRCLNTGEGYVRETCLPPDVERGPPTEVHLVPLVLEMQSETDLDISG